MGLTKEECQKAYKQLHFDSADLTHLSVFAQLIKEHFDNPPLKFEENEKWLISKIFQNYYCMGIDEIAKEDETAKSIFEKIGLTEVSS